MWNTSFFETFHETAQLINELDQKSFSPILVHTVLEKTLRTMRQAVVNLWSIDNPDVYYYSTLSTWRNFLKKWFLVNRSLLTKDISLLTTNLICI